MLKDITIGQFFPGNSAVHRTDPRVKIVLVIAMIVSLFLAGGPVSYALIAGYLGMTIYISKVHLKMVLRGLKPILFIVVFTAVLNLFYTPGEVLWQWGFLHITKEGIFVAIEMVIRIMLLIIGTSMLTYTTSPIDLTDGLERLMGPLKKIHVPVHELAMMMSIALRKPRKSFRRRRRAARILNPAILYSVPAPWCRFWCRCLFRRSAVRKSLRPQWNAGCTEATRAARAFSSCISARWITRR